MARADYADDLKFAERAAHISLIHYNKLKLLVCNHQFREKNDEIYFFKKIKPKFSSELIYYLKLLQILSRWPPGDKNIQVEFIQAKLERIKYFFDLNEEFYCYYRFDCNYLDEQYFVRGNCDLHLNPDSFFFETDTSFCTTRDYKVAKIIANNRLQLYLLNKSAEPLSFVNETPIETLTWTESKAFLVEFIYGLYARGVFNWGKVKLKHIVSFCEREFHVTLGNYHKIFQEIRERKMERTKALNSTSESLIKFMDARDD